MYIARFGHDPYVYSFSYMNGKWETNLYTDVMFKNLKITRSAKPDIYRNNRLCLFTVNRNMNCIKHNGSRSTVSRTHDNKTSVA